LPETIRVSSGSAILLRLMGGVLGAKPSTIYLLTYYPGKCLANCGFCPQARLSTSKHDLLSRVTWPAFPLRKVAVKVREAEERGLAKRVCIQTVNYPSMLEDVQDIIDKVKSQTSIPISVCCQPISEDKIKLLAGKGIDRIGISLDAANRELFDRIKGKAVEGPYTWETQFKALRKAVEIFGPGRVSTHLIVGLGESDRDVTSIVQTLVDMGVYPSLFAFTPIPGTMMQNHVQPQISRYRRIQIGHYLITQRKTRWEDMKFKRDGQLDTLGVSRAELRRIVETGKPFLTSGCPDCNRPFYNERPSGPIYNYPRPLTSEEIDTVRKQVVEDGSIDGNPIPGFAKSQ